MLNKVFSMSLMTLKQHYKGIGIGILFSLVYIGAWLSRQPKSFTPAFYQYELFKVNHIVLLFMACQILVNDFVHGCVKTLYTGAMSRLEVLSSKVLTLVELAVLLWLVSRGVYVFSLIRLKKGITLETLMLSQHITSLFIYVLTALLIGSAMAVVVSLFQKQKMAFVVGFLGLSIMQYFMPLFIYSNLFGQVPGLQSLLYLTPNYILLEWTTKWHLAPKEFGIFVIWIAAAGLLANWIVEKRSIRL